MKREQNESICMKIVICLKTSGSKLFFSRFARKKANIVDASLSDLYEHFKSLAGVLNDNIDDDYSNDKAVIYEQLDVEMTMKKIEHAIVLQCIKKDKSHGLDGIINEYFLEFKDILMPFYTLFSMQCIIWVVFQTLCVTLLKGQYTNRVILQILVISLLSCMKKLFVSILNKSIISWAENNDVITNAQFGFRQLHSTVDAIFAVQTIVNK